MTGMGARARRLAAAIYELPDAGTRFAAIEGFRAYAALLVFLVHYCDSYATRILRVDLNGLRLSTVPDAWTGVVHYFFASHYGVDVFFLLSGFLICRMVRRPTFAYRTFLLRRITRIYPAFLVSLLVWASVRIAVQQWYALEPAQLAGNLLFLNAVPALGVKPYNTVTWSLFFEFVFYTTFPLIRWGAAPGRPVTPARVVVFAVLFMVPALQLGGFVVRFLMFFGGALLATLPEHRLQAWAGRVPDWLAVGLYVASTALFAEWLDYPVFIPIFLVTTSLVLLRLTHGDGPLRRWFAWTPCRYLGNVSYSFYLTHGLAIELTMNAGGDLFPGLGGPAYLAATFAASLGLGIALATALFVLAERPYFTWGAVARAAVPAEYPAPTPARAK